MGNNLEYEIKLKFTIDEMEKFLQYSSSSNYRLKEINGEKVMIVGHDTIVNTKTAFEKEFKMFLLSRNSSPTIYR